MKVKKAVIPVAGLGTRFLPATKAISKEILPVIDTPVIQFIVEEAVASGIEDILIVTGKGKREIEDHFDANYPLEKNLEEKGKTDLLAKIKQTNNLNIHYVRQHYPRGLGDAINQAKTFVGNDPFLVLLGDDISRSEVPLSKQLMDLYETYKAPIIGGVRVKDEETKRYGMIGYSNEVAENIYEVNQLIEKPESNPPSNLAICGRYILEPSIFPILEQLEPDNNKEIELTDALDQLQRMVPVYAYDYQGEWYEVGEKFGLLKASIIFAMDHPEIKETFRNYITDLATELKANRHE